MTDSNETFFNKTKSFFGDRRASKAAKPPADMPCRRGKGKAQFGGATTWYLSTAIDVEEVTINPEELNQTKPGT